MENSNSGELGFESFYSYFHVHIETVMLQSGESEPRRNGASKLWEKSSMGCQRPSTVRRVSAKRMTQNGESNPDQSE